MISNTAIERRTLSEVLNCIEISKLAYRAAERSYVTFITNSRTVDITYHAETSTYNHFQEAINIIWLTKMVAEKSGPSFASILTIVSIVIYTGGLVRIELKFNEQKEKIHELENVVESMKTSNNDVARGKLTVSQLSEKQNKPSTTEDNFSLSRWKLRIVFESTPSNKRRNVPSGNKGN